MIGLKTEAVLAKKDGSWVKIGVKIEAPPNWPTKAIIAYGDQAKSQMLTLVMATLAMRTSALSADLSYQKNADSDQKMNKFVLFSGHIYCTLLSSIQYFILFGLKHLE